MHVIGDIRVGDQAHASGIQADTGQGQGGRHVRILRIRRGCRPRAALEDGRRRGEAGEIKHLFGRCAAPACGRLATGIDDLVEAAEAGGGEGIDRADRPGQQIEACAAGARSGFKSLRQAGLRQSTHRQHAAFDPTRQRRQHMLQQGAVPRTFEQQFGIHRHLVDRAGGKPQLVEHLLGRFDADAAHHHMGDQQLRHGAALRQQCASDGAAADQGDARRLCTRSDGCSVRHAASLWSGLRARPGRGGR